MQASQRALQVPWWVSPQSKTKATTKPRVNKKTARKTRVSTFAVFLVLTGLLAAAVMANVAEHALIAQESIELESLKGELRVEQALREELLIKRAELESPERIENLAVGKLGMVKPEQVGYLYLADLKLAKVENAESRNSVDAEQQDAAALPPILGEIVEQVRITAISSPEKEIE